MATFDEMKVEEVYYLAGTFANTRKKYKRAPFRRVQIPGLSAETFFEPTPTALASISGKMTFNISDYVDGADEMASIFGEGYVDMNRLTMDGPHMLGDWKGATGDNWQGVHQVGYV